MAYFGSGSGDKKKRGKDWLCYSSESFSGFVFVLHVKKLVCVFLRKETRNLIPYAFVYMCSTSPCVVLDR